MPALKCDLKLDKKELLHVFRGGVDMWHIEIFTKIYKMKQMDNHNNCKTLFAFNVRA